VPQDIFSCFVDVCSDGIFREISFEQTLKNDGDDKSVLSGTRVRGNNYLLKLTLKHIYLDEEENNGSMQEPPRADHTLEQNK